MTLRSRLGNLGAGMLLEIAVHNEIFMEGMVVVVQIKGEITYNGEPFKAFWPQRTAAYIAQVPQLAPSSPADSL